jgi:uncharacterized membrane protein
VDEKGSRRRLKVPKNLVSAKAVQLAAIALLMILLWIFVNFMTCFFVGFFLVVLIFGIDRRLPLVIALFLLVVAPFVLLLNQTASATAVGEWAYLFLGVGVVLLLIDHFKAKGAELKRSEGQPEQSGDQAVTTK